MGTTNRLVIIGSGLAGYMVAKEWRKLDKETPLTIITASDGSFYSKPLLSTALTNQKTADKLVVSTAESMAQDLDASILTQAEVLAIDAAQQQVVLTDQRIDYAQLVLACGADMIQPSLTGNALADIRSVNDLEAYRDFRQWLEGKQHIAIMGTGLVGCEFANDLINAGYHITQIAPDHHPLASFVPPAVGQQLQRMFTEKGVNWHFGRFVQAVNHAANGGYQLELDNGEVLTADGIFSAVGLRPHLGLALSAGLDVNYGIVVDRHLRTSHPNIYALGDCAEVGGLVKQYVAPILQCARTLGKVLAGSNGPVQYPVMPVVIKTPACPVVAYPPSKHIVGDWHVEGDDHHLRALFYDRQGQLHGYALVGDKVRDKMSLAKQLPLVFTD